MGSDRRGILLLLGAVIGVSAFGPGLIGRIAPLPEFTPLPGLPGFRRMGPAPGAVSPLALPMGAGSARSPVAPPADPCAALFGAQPGVVPIALFTDFNCPSCQSLGVALEQRVAEDGRLRLHWHDWPILGPASVTAARAALAAEAQGGRAAMTARLRRGALRPSAAHLSALAAEAGLDGARLLADMADPRIDDQLAQTAALAGLLGLVGTPGLVVGRTVVNGTPPPPVLTRLIRHEAARPGACSGADSA